MRVCVGLAKDVKIVAYSELVKNLDNIRMVMRDFYVYGFKSKADFSDRSARSHDNDRRRIESWLADYMCFRQNAKGKRRFIAVDSRKIKHNPFYKAWKAKTFTSKDIMLHFYLLDMLQDGISMSLNELVERLDQDEPYILQCLEREKRCGEVTKLSEGRYLFTADVRDAGELLPWLRTFIGRIESFSCSNKKIEERFWRDMEAVYAMYGLSEAGGEHE